MKTAKKILIIEDEKDLLSLLSEALKEEGFDVIGVQNGADGLAIVEEQKPNLVLLDLNIPGMDGLTFLKKLRGSKKGAYAPVIIFSNSSNVEDLSEAMEQGVLFYLAKSNWELEDVVKKVKEVLDLS